MDKKICLKVKIKSLAAEAKIIRELESKTKTPWLLKEHRVGIVRSEQRHTLLAYGFLRGRPYAAMEAKLTNTPAPDFNKIKKLVDKYGFWYISWELDAKPKYDPTIHKSSYDFEQQLRKEAKESQESRWTEWLEAAQLHLNSQKANN